jgi:hypothetical protein
MKIFKFLHGYIDDSMVFYVNGEVRMRIYANGSFGIGV